MPRRDQQHGWREEQAGAEDDQQDTAKELDQTGISDYHVGDRRHAEGGDGREQPVTKHGADTGGKAAPESVGNGPLDAKDVDRPDGRRYQQPDTNAGEHQLDAG